MIRDEVIAEARSWIRTPYHHWAAVKGIGADCAKFPIAVYVATGVIAPYDPGYYPRDWHMHRSEERYLQHLAIVGGVEITREEMLPGDFVVWRYGRCWSHGGIMTTPTDVVHAFIENGCVAEDCIDTCLDLRDRQPRFFTLGGLDGRR